MSFTTIPEQSALYRFSKRRAAFSVWVPPGLHFRSCLCPPHQTEIQTRVFVYHWWYRNVHPGSLKIEWNDYHWYTRIFGERVDCKIPGSTRGTYDVTVAAGIWCFLTIKLRNQAMRLRNTENVRLKFALSDQTRRNLFDDSIFIILLLVNPQSLLASSKRIELR